MNNIFRIMVGFEGLKIDEYALKDASYLFYDGKKEHTQPLLVCHDKQFLDTIFNIGFLENPQYSNRDINIYIETYGLQVLKILRDYPYLYFPLDDLQISESDVIKYTFISFLNAVQVSRAMWFVKDNSITPNSAITYNGPGVPKKYPASYNGYDVNYLATGERKDVYFSVEELNEASKWYKLILDNTIFARVREFKNGGPEFDNIPNLPSFHRALDFLNYARCEKNISSKIALYISILECIFGVKGENTQKVSERAAWFIGTSGNERLDIYETLKNSYRERSNYIHGSMIKQSEQVVRDRKEVVQNLDNIVRNLFKKIMEPKYKFLDYEPKDLEKIDSWFNMLVISGEEPSNFRETKNT